MKQEQNATISFAIEGMTCGSCVTRVRSALQGIEGVEDVEVTLRPGTARVVVGAGVEEDQLIAAVRAAGYRAATGSSAGLPVIAAGGSCCS